MSDPPLRTLILCDSLREGLRLSRSLQGARGVVVRVLVANGAARPLAAFAASLVRAIASEPIGAIGLAARGRLRVTWRRFDDPRLARSVDADIGLHASGAIYRRVLLDRFVIGVLNSHIGLLPRYRGRSVMEWSILEGGATGITAFLVDEGIDTGPIVLCREVPIPAIHRDVAAAKSHLFSLDGEMYAAALGLLLDPEFRPIEQAAEDGVRFYAMSRLLSDVASELLSSRSS